MNNAPINMKKLLVILGAATLIAGSIIYMMKKRPDGSMTARESRPITVEVMQAKPSSIARKKTFSGVLKSAHNIPLVSETNGRIDLINCKPGDMVEKGQLLFQLDSEQAIASVNEAKANFAYTKQALLRAEQLGSSIAKSQKEKIATECALAKAKLETALAQEKATKIIAPFAGQLGTFSITRGTHVSPNQTITRLVAIGDLDAEFEVPESDIKHFKVGQTIEVLSESHDDLPVSATITAMDPYSDHATHTVRIQAKLGKESRKLRDGAFAKITVGLGQAEDVIAVPRQAVMTAGDTHFVFLFDNGRARQVAIVRGIEDDSRIQIEDGVPMGATIIIDPVENMYDNASVQIGTDAQKGAQS
jgi:membrane fusion protein (multidrug efflux system)